MIVVFGSSTGPELARPSYDTSTQNPQSNHEESERRITSEEAAGLLCVAPDALTSEAGPPQSVVGLIEVFLEQHFPKIPADVEQTLSRHLLEVQETLLRELVRLAPRLHSEGLLECCHQQTFKHLDHLLRMIRIPRELLFLINWVLHTYLRYLSLLDNPVYLTR